MEFKLGDKVRLKVAPTPTMCVAGFNIKYGQAANNAEVKCIWFVEGKIHSFYFPKECLVNQGE